MATTQAKRISERRAEHLLNDLLVSQGWILRKPPHGDVLFQHKYRNYVDLSEALAKASKKGIAHGIPEAILIDRNSSTPLATIEVKSLAAEIGLAISETQGYADALWNAGWTRWQSHWPEHPTASSSLEYQSALETSGLPLPMTDIR
jgi:hypothetical protein